MTICLGKSCSFSVCRKLLSIYVFSNFPFGFEGRMWDLIVSVSDQCLSFYFGVSNDLLIESCSFCLTSSSVNECNVLYWFCF